MKRKREEPTGKIGKEIYILKIYRRSTDPLNSLVGTIEEINGKKKGVFNTEMDLLNWIAKQKAI